MQTFLLDHFVAACVTVWSLSNTELNHALMHAVKLGELK